MEHAHTQILNKSFICHNLRAFCGRQALHCAHLLWLSLGGAISCVINYRTELRDMFIKHGAAAAAPTERDRV